MSRAAFFAGRKQGRKTQEQLAKEVEKKRKAAYKRALAKEKRENTIRLAAIKRDTARAQADKEKYKNVRLFSTGGRKR